MIVRGGESFYNRRTGNESWSWHDDFWSWAACAGGPVFRYTCDPQRAADVLADDPVPVSGAGQHRVFFRDLFTGIETATWHAQGGDGGGAYARSQPRAARGARRLRLHADRAKPDAPGRRPTRRR